MLVLIGAAYATQRAVEKGGTRWLVLAGVLVGVGFLAKMLQAFLVLPALTAVWLLAAPVGWWRRIRDLLLAGVAMLVSAGWWVLVVELWPADSRPYIGGSQTNSVLELVFGYNGFGRLTGDETGSVGGSPGGGWGQTGITRLFGSEMGGRRVVAAARRARAARGAAVAHPAGPAQRLRCAPPRVLWGGWLLVTGLVFSFMAGIIHPYYTVALAPAVAALVGARGGAAVAGPRRADVAGDAGRGARADGRLGLVPAGADDLAAVADLGRAGLVGLAGVAGLLGVHRMPRAAVVGRRDGGAGGRARAGPTALRAGHRGDPAHRRDPVGRARRVRGGMGGPGGVRGADRGGRAATARGDRRPGRAGAAPGARRAARGDATGGGPAGSAGPAGRPRRRGRPARLPHAQRRAHGAPGAGRRLLHLGRRRRRLQQRRGLPARHAGAGDGRRRVQRHRPGPDARAVPGPRGRQQDPLLRRRRNGHRRPRRVTDTGGSDDATRIAAVGAGRTSRPRPSAAPPSTTSPGPARDRVADRCEPDRVGCTAGAQVDHKDRTAPPTPWTT